MARKMSKRAMQQLNQAFLDDIFNAGEKLKQMIEVRSWEADGYGSFLAFWDAKCREIPFTLKDRNAAAYQMFNEGASDEDVATAIDGISADGAESLRRQKEGGVPPEGASPNFRGRRKSSASQDFPKPLPDTLFLRLGAPVVAEYGKYSMQVYGKSATEVATDAALRELEYMKRQPRPGVA